MTREDVMAVAVGLSMFVAVIWVANRVREKLFVLRVEDLLRETAPR